MIIKVVSLDNKDDYIAASLSEYLNVTEDIQMMFK